LFGARGALIISALLLVGVAVIIIFGSRRMIHPRGDYFFLNKRPAWNTTIERQGT
jgi:hypothetical protein